MDGINCEGLREYIEFIDKCWSELSDGEREEILSIYEVEWNEFTDTEKLEIYESEIFRRR